MVGKFIRRVLVVMVIIADLVLKVQANAIAPTSFGPSSFPKPLAPFSQLDVAKKSIIVCHEEEFDRCEVWRKRLGPLGMLHYGPCIFKAFVRCTGLHYGHPKASVMEQCVDDCLGKKEYRPHKCVLQCFERHLQYGK